MQNNSNEKKLRRTSRQAWLTKMGEKQRDEIRKQKETRREMAKMKQKILNVEEGNEDASDDKLKMRAAERLYYYFTTEMHDARNRAKSWFFEEIGYALALWKNSVEGLIRELYQNELSWVNADAKCGAKEVDIIPLLSVSDVTCYV